MKKLVMVGGMLLAVASSALAGNLLQTSTASAAAPRCTAKADGARSSAFAINGTTATVNFRVTGPAKCKVKLSSNSFYAPSMNGKPYNKQVLFQRVTDVYGPGQYTMSVQLPPTSTPQQGCFYQVDLTYGTHNRTPVLAYGHGTVPCGEQPKKIMVCDLATKTFIQIDETSFDTSKHSKNPEDCKQEEMPKMIEVCLIHERTRINIREDQYDSSIHTMDFSVCDEKPEVPETPEKPKEETPKEMPKTGPLESAAQMVGIGSLVASAGYYIQSRRQ